MPILSSCSGCGKSLSVADEHAGKQAKCPACGQIYTVPFPADVDGFSQGVAPAAPSPSGTTGSPLTTIPSPSEFWMRAPDGNEYGPVDRANLNRWFQEGRVGPEYQVRQGRDGEWQPADKFKLQPAGGNPYTGAGNPYAASNPYAAPAGQARRLHNYPKGDQSGLILAMGILGLFVCPIFGVIAWVMGGSALKDIASGNADPANKGLVQAGYYCGIVSSVLTVVCLGGYAIVIAVAIISGM